ncbi:MAG: hypothetical protein ACE5DX_02055 [Candidatus Dojkabacteria bacterium]
MSSDSQNPSEVVQEELIGPKSGLTLKSIFNDASYLKSILIFSAVLNLLLLCGVIALMGQQGSTPGPVVTPIPTDSPTPTPEITETPEEELTRLQKCFQDCESRDFLTSLEIELGKTKHFKATGDFSDLTKDECYGSYSEHTSPNKSFTSYFLAQVCSDGMKFDPPPAEYRIGNTAFFYNASNSESPWEKATITPSAQTAIVDVVDLIQSQQTIESSFEQRGTQRVRVLTAEGEKVNDFNQLVETIVQVKVNEDYQIVYFRNFEEKGFNENGRFWDYGVPNKIESPIPE